MLLFAADAMPAAIDVFSLVDIAFDADVDSHDVDVFHYYCHYC